MTFGRPAADTARLSWSPLQGADSYSVAVQNLALLAAGEYDLCSATGTGGTSYDDVAVLAPGEGRGFIVQGTNAACGVGTLGFDSGGDLRVNDDPGACP